MKIKNNIRLLTTIGILFTIGIAPIAGTVFAQTSSGNEDNVQGDTVTDKQRPEIQEDMKNYKDEMKKQIKQFREDKQNEFKERFAKQDKVRPDVAIDVRPFEDREPELRFKGETSGWTIIGSKAYTSEIMFSGLAYHVSDNMWKLKTTGEFTIADREVTIDMNGFVRGDKIVLHGNDELQNGEKVRLGLRGHYAPTTDEGVFAIAFTHAMYKNIDTGEKIPMMQVGKVFVEQVNPTTVPEDSTAIEPSVVIPTIQS